MLHAQVDEDKSGEIEFAEFLRLAERQKQAQARPDNGDTVEAFVALGGKVDALCAVTAAGLLVHLTGCLFVVQQCCAIQTAFALKRCTGLPGTSLSLSGKGGCKAWLCCSAVHMLPVGSGCGVCSVHIYKLARKCYCCRPIRAAKSC